MKRGKMPPPAFLERIKEERVAIVGAGPTGLNCAYHLGRRGYQVTIFEALPVVGGMLAVGIPDFRLPPEIIEYDVRFIRQHNVDIQLNKALGKDFTIEDLLNQGHKAVFLALGAHGNIRLNIPGEDSAGVLPGVDFLRRVNLGEDVQVGEKVAVVGGGNVAIDAARMAVRLGAREVSIVYRRTAEEMPANPEEVEEAEDEKIQMMYLLAPTRILTENGKVKGLECIRMELGDYDETGRRRPIPVKGSEFVLDVDTIIPEVGYTPEVSCLPPHNAFKIRRNGTLEVDPLTLATHIPGVFAGGDVVIGPSMVVEAMAQGYQAAQSIDRYLKGQDLYKDRVYRPLRRADVAKPEMDGEQVEAIKPRARMAYLGVGRRVRTFSEVNLGFGEEAAVLEAKRCLRCDLER
jgi:NADH-quinone oxidoreductase subunit F